MLAIITFPLFAVLLMLSLTSCSEKATLSESAGTGPQPTLPAPNPTLIPTVDIAPAKGGQPVRHRLLPRAFQ